MAVPRHIAISLYESPSAEMKGAYQKRNEIIRMLISEQARLQIPIMSLYLLDLQAKQEEFSESVDSLTALFENLSDEISINRIKVSFIGKWYGLPGRVVEAARNLIEVSHANEGFCLNFCLNYDGQEEIVDACRLISMKAVSGKLDSSGISKQTIKENIYSSSFTAPALIIKNNPEQLCDMLLWDSVNSRIYFTGKDWAKFEKRDLKRALDKYSSFEGKN